MWTLFNGYIVRCHSDPEFVQKLPSGFLCHFYWCYDIVLFDHSYICQVSRQLDMATGFCIPFDDWVRHDNWFCCLMFLHKYKSKFKNIFFRRKLWRHIVRCWKAMTIGQERPELPHEDEMFNKKISFFEAISESLPQFTIGNIIIRIYGISDNMTTKFFQLFSLATSMLSLNISFITVSDVDLIMVIEFYVQSCLF